MSKFVRHDAITLKAGADETAFMDFMNKELIPFFKSTYKNLTRISIANIAGQMLLKDLGKEGRFVWVNTWTGPVSAISDPAFSGTQMTDLNKEKTIGMLEKIKTFGKRSVAAVYEETEA